MGDFIHDVHKALKIGNSIRKPVLHIVTFIYLVINIYWPQGKEEVEIQTSDLHFMRHGLQSFWTPSITSTLIFSFFWNALNPSFIVKNNNNNNKCNVNQIRFLNFSWLLKLANEL